MRGIFRFLMWLYSKPTKEGCPTCGKHEILGKELIFISCILRDGSGVIDVSKKDMKFLDNDEFHIGCLSMSQNTYIAMGFNSYVVKLKNQS